MSAIFQDSRAGGTAGWHECLALLKAEADREDPVDEFNNKSVLRDAEQAYGGLASIPVDGGKDNRLPVVACCEIGFDDGLASYVSSKEERI